MQITRQVEASLFSLLPAWATHRLAARLAAMKPEYTAEEAATAAALSGNPSGA